VVGSDAQLIVPSFALSPSPIAALGAGSLPRRMSKKSIFLPALLTTCDSQKRRPISRLVMDSYNTLPREGVTQVA